LAAIVAASFTPAPAAATPRTFPFTYPYHTLPAGEPELEQYVDIVPTRVSREKDDGTLEGVLSHRYVLQTEFEYGITDRLEGAFYVVFRQAGELGAPLRFQGVKQRLRYRLATEAEWPVGVAVYFEVAEFHDEIEIEEKIILGRRFGRLQILANAWFEQEYYFQDQVSKFIYNPTVGASWEISPRLIPGLEYWVRGRFGGSETGGTEMDAPSAAHHYLGPTLLLQGRKMWISLGAYLGLDSLGDGFQVGAAYGPLWVRALVGLEF
jgi:hypothetical protein